MVVLLLVLVLVFFLVAIVVASYMGWFKFSARNDKGASGISFSVDESKMTADKNKAADKLKAL